MTTKQLKERCAYWQDRMNLREWKIDVQLGNKRTMKDDKGQPLAGWCTWVAEESVALVRVARGGVDQEETLVHELLHIVIQGHTAEQPDYDVSLEKAINRLAAALVAE